MQAKFENYGKQQVGKNWRDSLDLEAELEKGRRLDQELTEVDQKPQKTPMEVERLVSKWQDQKKVLGVKDSDVESRAQILFAMLDTDNVRRRQYLNDMEMFKKKFDDTKATTSSNVMRIKQIEDIIVQRDRRV